MNTKVQLFEYYLFLFSKWYCENNRLTFSEFNISNDLSKLKVIKLHFFACSTKIDTLRFFNRFCAMPYGHVESDVFNAITTLSHFSVTGSKLIIKNIGEVSNIFAGLAASDEGIMVSESVERLRAYNPHIINFSPFDLVELSHRWFSWQYAFNMATAENKASHSISPEIIINETKIYSL